MAGWTDIVDSAVTNTLNTAKLGYSIYQDQRNSAFSREQFDYQKALNQQIMDREDTAIQRRVADAEAAGISKYAVAGQGASASALSTFGGSMGSQKLDGSKFDMMNAILQTQEQAARTKLAQAEYKFYRDTADERKSKISLENLAIGASTKRTNSETAGIDIANLISGRRNLLDENEYGWLSDDNFKNFRAGLAYDLFGRQYDTEMKQYSRDMKKRDAWRDFVYGDQERGMSYRQAMRDEDRDKRDIMIDRERYNWLMSQGEDGLNNLVKGYIADLLNDQSVATKNKKDADAATVDRVFNNMFRGVNSVLPIFLMLMSKGKYH